MGAVKQHSSAPEVWDAILGGINEGQSTGLRKWAAAHGKSSEPSQRHRQSLNKSAFPPTTCLSRSIPKNPPGTRGFLHDL